MLRVTNPATGALLAELTVDTAADIGRKIAAARAAQPAWARTPLGERAAALARFGAALRADVEPLARLLSEETGKPIAQARAEITATQGRLDFFLAHAAAVLADEVVFDAEGMTERITWEPLGVVANVSAWNYPYFVGVNVFAPALLGGNAVLYKPSEFASRTGLAIVERLHGAGVPAGAVQAVIGGGEVGAALVAADIDAIFFTGSYPTGVRIAQAAAPRLLRVQLELGGKDPVYVCDDAPIDVVAAAVADGAFYNTGQSCCAVERIYVHRAVAARFIDAFVAQVRGFVVGDPLDERTYIGPLTRAAQLEVLDAQVADARRLGARVLAGGARIEGAGRYFAPTVLAGVDHRMAVMRDESFGPVIGIQVVADDAEAAALMRDTAYGLTAAVYTPERARAERLLAGLPVGSAYWNCCDRVSPRLPWSGHGDSGIGLTLSTHGILAFTRPKAWHLRSP